MFDRRQFLFRFGAAGLMPAALAAAPVERTGQRRDFLAGALVLSGGGARGAYEAGLICELARIRGARDGMALPPYEFVCGTSIGALNAWFVATGQYSKLFDVWHTISQQNIVRLKPRFEKVSDSSAGIANRLMAAIRLTTLSKNEQGVAEDNPVYDWIERQVDPHVPLLMPMVWAATDLNAQRPEYFYRLARNERVPPEFIFQSLRYTVGPKVVIREANDDILVRSLQASAAIPLVFDPVSIVGADGKKRQYVDGGVAANSPVSIARTVAKGVDVILLDPPLEEEFLPNAIDVGLASFSTMQRKILETELSSTYFQSTAKREFQKLPPDVIAQLAKQSTLLNLFLNYLPASDLAYIRPAKELPVKVGGFDDQAGINETFQRGVADAGKGFTPYTVETF